MLKELGSEDDIEVFKKTAEYKSACARNKLLLGRDVYTCKTHKGFYLTSNSGLGYVHYKKNGDVIERVTYQSIIEGICLEQDPFSEYNNIHVSLTKVGQRIIITDDYTREISCIIGLDRGIKMNGDFYDIEQDFDYILFHLLDDNSLLVSKSDYSSIWVDRKISLV